MIESNFKEALKTMVKYNLLQTTKSKFKELCAGISDALTEDFEGKNVHWLDVEDRISVKFDMSIYIATEKKFSVELDVCLHINVDTPIRDDDDEDGDKLTPEVLEWLHESLSDALDDIQEVFADYTQVTVHVDSDRDEIAWEFSGDLLDEDTPIITKGYDPNLAPFNQRNFIVDGVVYDDSFNWEDYMIPGVKTHKVFKMDTTILEPAYEELAKTLKPVTGIADIFDQEFLHKLEEQ